MPQNARGNAVRKLADSVAVPLIAYRIASAGKVARLKICLHQTTQILSQSQPFLCCSNFGCLMNVRIDSGFYVLCESCS